MANILSILKQITSAHAVEVYDLKQQQKDHDYMCGIFRAYRPNLYSFIMYLYILQI